MGRASGRKNPVRAPAPGTPEAREIGMSALQDPAGSPIPSGRGNIVNPETERQQVESPPPMDEFRGMMAHGVPHEAHSTEERATAERGGPNEPHRPVMPREGHREPGPPPVPVYLTQPASGARPLTTIATAKLTITPEGSGPNPGPQRITSRDETRLTMYVMIETAAGSTNTLLTAGATPAVPATTVAQQNTTGFPVSVVIAANGATITAVVVNGITVGTGAGTYTVPVNGAISITYTVATPTWTWTELGTGPAGIRFDHEVSTLDVGLGALLKPGQGYQELKGCQDEIFAVSADTATVTLSVIYLYQLAGAL